MLPNGVRLSCGAVLEYSQMKDYPRKRGAVSFRRVLDSARANFALQVQLFGLVIAGGTKYRYTELLPGGADPLATGFFHTRLTLTAPGIRAGLLSITRPKEPDWQMSVQAEHDVLANEGLGLRPVTLALDGSQI